MMKISRYISQKIFYTYLILYFGIIGLLFIAQTIRLLKYIPASAIKFGYIFKFGTLLLPNSLYSASGIVGIIVFYSVYNSFLLTSELTSMKASGFSHFKILKPAIFAVIINFVVFFIVTFFITPRANVAFNTGIKNIRDGYILSILKSGEVVKFKNLAIYYQDLQDDKMLNFTILKTNNENDFNEFLSIFAKSAYIEEDLENGSWVVMNFVETSDVKIPKNKKEIIESNVQMAKEMRVQMSSLLTKTNEEGDEKVQARDSDLFVLLKKAHKNELGFDYYFEIYKRISIIYYSIFSCLVVSIGSVFIKTSRGKNGKQKISSIISGSSLVVFSYALPKILIKEGDVFFIGEIVLFLFPVIFLLSFYSFVKRI